MSSGHLLLQLGEDVLAVGVFPQGGDVRPDLVHQDLPLQIRICLKYLLFFSLWKTMNVSAEKWQVLLQNMS